MFWKVFLKVKRCDMEGVSKGRGVIWKVFLKVKRCVMEGVSKGKEVSY